MLANTENKMPSGILPVYKEKGYTSFDVVAKLRGILKIRKIGHTGTLDPDAEGVLAVCVGSATKLVEMLTERPKEYEAGLLLGIQTDTQDISGTVLSRVRAEISEEELSSCIASFEGGYAQIPPMYSALKINGRKLYELAREGKSVERKPRRIKIYSIDILGTELLSDKPSAIIRVRCSKGTYIRTLINDIGEKLGCGACMETLLRTEAAGFVLRDCLKLGEIEERVRNNGPESVIIPAERVFDEYPSVNVRPEFDVLLANGNALPSGGLSESLDNCEAIRVCSSRGEFKAVYERSGEFYKVRYML